MSSSARPPMIKSLAECDTKRPDVNSCETPASPLAARCLRARNYRLQARASRHPDRRADRNHLAQILMQFRRIVGGVVYDGIWVGEDSRRPNINGIRKELVEHLRRMRRPEFIRSPRRLRRRQLRLARRYRSQGEPTATDQLLVLRLQTKRQYVLEVRPQPVRYRRIRSIRRSAQTPSRILQPMSLYLTAR